MKVVILAGGGGTRLWPLSSEETPKQFIKLPVQDQSLFQLTLLRAMKIVSVSDITIVTNEKYQTLILEQARKLNVLLKDNQLFLESQRKNTLPAITAGVYQSKALDYENILVLPSDHIFGDDESFANQVNKLNQLGPSQMVLFGIKPTCPHTGYGYIETENTNNSLKSVVSFREKPNIENAIMFIQKGYFWNAGIFFFVTRSYKKALVTHAKELYDLFEAKNPQTAFLETDISTSIDYGLIEKMDSLYLQELDSSWMDLGSWDAYIEYFTHDQTQTIQLEAKNNTIINFESKETVVIGVDDLIVVNHPNGILISKKGQTQNVNQRKK